MQRWELKCFVSLQCVDFDWDENNAPNHSTMWSNGRASEPAVIIWHKCNAYERLMDIKMESWVSDEWCENFELEPSIDRRRDPLVLITAEGNMYMRCHRRMCQFDAELSELMAARLNWEEAPSSRAMYPCFIIIITIIIIFIRFLRSFVFQMVIFQFLTICKC